MKIWGFKVAWGRKENRLNWSTNWLIFAETKEKAIQFIVHFLKEEEKETAHYWNIKEVDFRTLQSANIKYLYEREVN